MSPNWHTPVSGSEDTTIKVWNLETAEEIKTLAQNLASVTSLAISFDGQFLVSANEDFSLKLGSPAESGIPVIIYLFNLP